MERAKEMERVYEAERRAREFVSILSPERFGKCGKAILMRDLTNEFLTRGARNPENKERKR